MNTNFKFADDVTCHMCLPDHVSNLFKERLWLLCCNSTTQSHILPCPTFSDICIIRPVFAVCTFNRVYVMYFVITISSAKLCRQQHLSEVAQGNTLGSG